MVGCWLPGYYAAANQHEVPVERGGGPPGAFSGIGVADVLLLEIGPIVVVAGAAQFANKKVADWCIAHVLGAEDQDSGPSTGTDFLERRVCELRRISLPRTPVNKG